MQKMKDSGIEWIGQIPEEWDISKIATIYEERNVKVSDKDYAPLSVTKQGIVPQLETAAKTDNGDNRKLIKKNDFVINSRSDRRGSCGISDYDGSCSLINTVLKPRKNMNNKYYNYVFRSELFADEFYRWGNGIVDDLWSTKWGNMKKIYVPFPDLIIQSSIADFLDDKCSKIDRYIEKQQQIIEKLEAYKQSVITETVTKGLDPNVPMKDSGIEWIGKINDSYSISKLGRFCFVTKLAGFEYTNTMAEAIKPDDDVPIVKAQNVRMFWFDKDKISEFIDQKTSEELSRCSLTKKCLIITFIGAGIGDVCVFNEPVRYHLAPNVAKIEIRDEFKRIINEEYLMYYLGSNVGKEEINRISKASAQPSLSMETIRGMAIILPDIIEQQKIVNFIIKKCSSIDLAILDRMRLIKKLSEYKKSLIYEAVTGKLEI